MPDGFVRRSGDDYAEAFAALLPTGPAWPRDADAVLMQVMSGLAQIWGEVDGRAADLLEIETDPRATMELLGEWERAFGLPERFDTVIPAPLRFRAGVGQVGVNKLLEVEKGFGFKERGPTPSLSLADRRSALLTKMLAIGGQSRAFFIGVAATLGYTITITEFSPIMAGVGRCGEDRAYSGSYGWFRAGQGRAGADPFLNLPGDFAYTGEQRHRLGPLENRFRWIVNVSGFRLSWFRAGAGRLGIDRLLSVSPQPRRFRVGSGQAGIDKLLRIERAFDLEAVLRRWKPAQTQVLFNYGQAQ